MTQKISYQKIIGAGLTLLLAGLVGNPASADIYRQVDAEGNTVFTDQRPADAESAARHSYQPAASLNSYTPPAQPSPDAVDNAAVDDTALDDTNARAKTHSTAATAANEKGEKIEEAAPERSEADCQREYRTDCDHVDNWRDYAIADCTDDPRCADPDFLDRKYRPRSTEELAAIARSSSVRENRLEEELNLYLKKRYTKFCPDLAARSCYQQVDRRQCEKSAEERCRDKRTLAQVLAEHDYLTPAQRIAVIKKAKEMALEQKLVDSKEILADMVEILLTAAAL